MNCIHCELPMRRRKHADELSVYECLGCRAEATVVRRPPADRQPVPVEYRDVIHEFRAHGYQPQHEADNDGLRVVTVVDDRLHSLFPVVELGFDYNDRLVTIHFPGYQGVYRYR